MWINLLGTELFITVMGNLFDSLFGQKYAVNYIDRELSHRWDAA